MAETRKVWMPVALLALLLPAQVRADDDAEARARDKAREWRRAAINRELAALPRVVEAERLRKTADALRVAQAKTDAERSLNIGRAGDLAMQSAGMEQGAASSFNAAASDWLRSADEYRKAGDLMKKKTAEANAEAATENVADATERAAECYELAATSYARREVGKALRAAAASDKAASARERLARLK